MPIVTPLTRVQRINPGGTRTVVYNSQGGSRLQAGLFQDTPSTGTYTYILQIKQASTGSGPDPTVALTAATMLVQTLKR